jgi:hypothetical protein
MIFYHLAAVAWKVADGNLAASGCRTLMGFAGFGVGSAACISRYREGIDYEYAWLGWMSHDGPNVAHEPVSYDLETHVDQQVNSQFEILVGC